MYIAMNRFKVQNGSETAFEDVWKNRDFEPFGDERFPGIPPAARPGQRG